MKSLKQARMSKGVTKKAMAEHLGISGPTYDVYEDHPDRMRIETAKKAADFLGYKPEEIFFASRYGKYGVCNSSFCDYWLRTFMV